MIKKIFCILILFTAVSVCANDLKVKNEFVNKKFALETEVIWPFLPGIHIYVLRGTYSFYTKSNDRFSEIIAGVYLRPRVKHEVVEKIDEYLANISYRQYFFRGLHLEAGLYGGWVWGWNNKKNGKDYSNPTLMAELNAGYRFDITENIYIMPQAGLFFGLYTDIGPRDDSDFFVTGKLIVGCSF